MNGDSSGMFDGCEILTAIRFHANVDTSRVTDLRAMFRGCKRLTELMTSGRFIIPDGSLPFGSAGFSLPPTRPLARMNRLVYNTRIFGVKGVALALTKLDMELLDLLREDCRLPLEKLAVMTGASVAEVAEAIERMERERVILRYAPTINWDKTDRDRVEAMIEVRVTPQRDMGFDAIAKRIYRFEEVKSVYLMSGSYDLLVLVEARTLKELALFVSEKLSPLETVTGTATSFVLKRYKEEGVIFEGENADNRLVISP